MVIVDASCVYKWFDEKEIDFDKANLLLEKHLSKKESLGAPDLIVYELANAWGTKTKIGKSEALENLSAFEDANINLIGFNYNLFSKAIVFGKKYKVSVYDAAYAVLAKEKKCNLITADDKFVDQVNLPFVKKLSSIA